MSHETKSKSKHIHKCMSNSSMINKFPNTKQRLAVCNSLWEDKSSDLESL